MFYTNTDDDIEESEFFKEEAEIRVVKEMGSSQIMQFEEVGLKRKLSVDDYDLFNNICAKTAKVVRT